MVNVLLKNFHLLRGNNIALRFFFSLAYEYLYANELYCEDIYGFVVELQRKDKYKMSKRYTRGTREKLMGDFDLLF